MGRQLLGAIGGEGVATPIIGGSTAGVVPSGTN
jgi:hypothetical protein